MSRKQDQPSQRKTQPVRTPSTGRGAASALDALIKRRAAAPGQDNEPLPSSAKEHR